MPPAPPSQSMQQSHNSSSSSQALRPPPSASAARGASAVSYANANGPSPSVKAAASAALPAGCLPLSATAHGVDGLPMLPSHAQSCEVDPPRALLPLDYEAFNGGGGGGGRSHAHATAVVDVFGDVSSRDAIREKLLRFYQDTKQVAGVVVDEKSEERATSKKSSGVEIVGDGISEMTLRIDTELELLRQQCFAERNAQWGYHTPDMFSYEPVREPMWNPLLVGNANIALRRLKHDLSLDRDEKEGNANAIATAGGGGNGSGGVSGKKDGKGFALGEFSRERPWPPREFMQKVTTRPSRARGGKRKAPAPIVEQRSVFSKVCVECHTQSTPLWRKIARESSKLKKEEATTNGVNHVKSEPGDTKVPIAPAVTNGALATAATPSMTTEPSATTATTPVDQAQPLQTVGQEAEVDVCLECYLKLQRSDIFARKQLERAQKEREKQERVAAEAALEKKRLKQQLQMLKKQQQAQAKSKKRKPTQQQELVVAPETEQQEPVSEVTTAPATAIKIVIKTDVVREDHHVQTLFDAQREDNVEQYEREHPRSAKRDKKKSKKDKKKKKKKKRRDDSDDDESDSGTPMPSPPQMVGQYEYADLAGGGLRTSRSASSVTSFDAVVESHNVEYEDGPVQQQTTAKTNNGAVVEKQEHVVEEQHYHEEDHGVAVDELVTTSKRTRKSTSRRDSVTTISTTTSTTVTASSSKSRKRKNSVVTATAAPAPIEPVAETQTTATSFRSSRSRASSSSVASVVVPAVAPVVPAATVTTPARKRARTKKESARERELRALGQYCPVCNFVYEEDDESSFVCCDSCEMWVHAACDTTLTPALLAALADTAEKYICPLCAGR